MIRPRMSGVRIGGSGTRDVVEGDRQPHARAQQRVERVHAERGVERGGDRRRDVGEALQRRRRVDDPRADGEALEPELTRRSGTASAASARRPRRRRPRARARCGASCAGASSACRRGRSTRLMRRSAGRRRSSRGRCVRRAARAPARALKSRSGQPWSTGGRAAARPASSSAAPKSSLVAVGAAELELALPRRVRGRRETCPGMPTRARPAARPGDGDGGLERCAGAHAVEYPVEAAEQQLAADLADETARAGEPRALEVQLVGRADVVGAEARAPRRCPSCLATREHRGVGRELAQRGERQQARSSRRR